MKAAEMIVGSLEGVDSKIKRDLPEVNVWLEFFLVTTQEQRRYKTEFRISISECSGGNVIICTSSSRSRLGFHAKDI